VTRHNIDCKTIVRHKTIVEVLSLEDAVCYEREDENKIEEGRLS